MALLFWPFCFKPDIGHVVSDDDVLLSLLIDITYAKPCPGDKRTGVNST